MKSPSRPTVAEVDLNAIAYNLRGVRTRVGKNVKIMAVVKANAYGHGAATVSSFLESSLADYFGVAFPEEGASIRQAGIKKPIHVFTLATEPQLSLYADFRLEPTVCTPAHLEALNSLGVRRKKTFPVHVKIETGMNRIGARPNEWDAMLRSLARQRRVEVKGIFTHFATSGEKDRSFALQQLTQFQRALEYFRKAGIEPELSHCANSGAILDLKESYLSMVRPGIMTYGYYPSKNSTESIPLKPAMSLRTTVAHVKSIEPGESVSYGRRFNASRKTTIATIPIGYADGLFRTLTNRVEVLVQGRRMPVVGTICMDQCMVDCGDARVRVGEEVVVMGRQGKVEQTAWALTEPVGTIPYELLCGISGRVPRIYKKS